MTERGKEILTAAVERSDAVTTLGQVLAAAGIDAARGAATRG